MSSNIPAVTNDLIDLSDSIPSDKVFFSVSNDEYESSNLQSYVTVMSPSSFDDFVVEDQKHLSLADYVRKPRTYSREKTPSIEDNPPPLPPKRRSQSRKNRKLTSRLLSAGIDINSSSNSPGTSSPSSSFDEPDFSGFNRNSEDRSQSAQQFDYNKSFINTPVSINLNNADAGYSMQPTDTTTSGKRVANTKLQNAAFDNLKPMSYLDPASVSLLQDNLVEFEQSLKGLGRSKSQEILSNQTSDWSACLGNTSTTDTKPLNSLSVEDLNTFINSFAQTTFSEIEPFISNPFAQKDGFSEVTATKIVRTLSTLPPPRPVPPKVFNRLSLPSSVSASNENDAKLYFGDGIFDLAEERNVEAMEFCKKVAGIRRFFTYSMIETNPGFVCDSVVNFDNNGWRKDIDIEVFYESYADAITIVCDMFSNVQDAVLKSLLVFQNSFKDIDTISKNKYVFKVCGQSCYLEGNEPIINYSYVQNCVKLGEKVNVTVIARSRIRSDLSRTKEDDSQEAAGTYFKHFFNIQLATAISRQGLSVLIETYNLEVEKLIANVTKSTQATYIPEKLIQIVKALSLSLACIESTQLHEAINLLLSLKSKNIQPIVSSTVEAGVIDFNRIISSETFDRGRFDIALEKLTSAVYSLVDSYCRAFDTDFAVHDPKDVKANLLGETSSPCERVSAESITEKFSIKISSAHRLPTEWKLKYDSYEIECGLFYGGRSICDPVVTKARKMTKGFYEHIKWDEVLSFDLPVKEIPCETKICLRLFGLTSARKQTRDPKNSSELGWISCNVFDFRGLLITGSQIFGLLSGTEMNPAAICSSSNIQEPTSVILRTDFEVYHSEIVFPEALVQTNHLIDCQEASSEVPPEIYHILSKSSLTDLSIEQKELLWKNRFSLKDTDKAFPYVLASVPNLKPETLKEAQDLAHIWQTLSPNIALGLLTASFPDTGVRNCAVNWLSVINESELCDYLPQLVQALKYESYHTSALSTFLITSAIKSPKVAHFLFWHLKYYTADAQFSQRFQIILGGLLSVCGAAMKDQLSRQDLMVQQLAKTTLKLKQTKDNLRRNILSQDLDFVAVDIDSGLRLPFSPSVEVRGVIPESCSYFNSFTVPLAIVFENADSRGSTVKSMFKVGDDLRKDLVTLQLFRVMNRLWLSESLDLKMITYECMPTAPEAGILHLVPNAATLREIHVQHGVTGSFKDEVIGLWLQKYNQSEGEYQTAVENFSASCAAYCVATYVLGIGDRHNDNIMVTQKGHLFHIDFSKFMGNVQKFGTIRRDRVPFVLTPDMAYVINFGDEMSHNFQHFVELCCDAFNILRKNSDLILNLLGLMVSSGIPYLSSPSDIEYVRHALQLDLTDAQAMVFFTRLIETSLSSKSTQLNFFIHNMAHMKDSQNTSGRAIFSFSSKVYSKESDGEIVSVRCVDIQKRYVPDKHYIFVLNILRNDNKGPRFVFRKYEEFQELHTKLAQVFGTSNVPSLPGKVLVGRSEIRDIAVRRRFELDEFLVQVMGRGVFSNSEILYTFLHSFIRDEQDSFKFADILIKLEEGLPRSRVGGEIKLSYQYSKERLNLLVMHARNLIPRTIQGTADPYVKSYLLPDPNKSTKRKTRVARRNLHPTYNQTMSYVGSLEMLQQKVLQVTVWDNDSFGVNDFLGGVNIYLATHDLTQERTQWYELKDFGIGM